MTKFINETILDKVSENNNDYRINLEMLDKLINEKVSSLVGDIVTLSNYTLDFSNAVIIAKEKLSEPISKVVESYVIKDLRSVETVNEQFIDKINDKIESSNISNEEEKSNFIENLNTLLNEKYLQIVKIKRIPFTNADGINDSVEACFNDFINYINESFNGNKDSIINEVSNIKNKIYMLISETLVKISNLYLSNFVNEITTATNNISINNSNEIDNIAPIMDLPVVPDLPSISDIPSFDEELVIPNPIMEDEVNNDDMTLEEMPIENTELDEPTILFDSPVVEEEMPSVEAPITHDYFESANDVSLDIPEVKLEEPEIKEEPTTPIAPVTQQYDVEEILKRAKSPIVSIPNEPKKEELYEKVEKLEKVQETELDNTEFNEKEIVMEMIRRLNNRLDEINAREEEYNEAKKKLDDDENFVNDLIESSNNKKKDLDAFEQELNDKEKELENKEKDLEKKLNDILPFANAVMKNDRKDTE